MGRALQAAEAYPAKRARARSAVCAFEETFMVLAWGNVL